MKYTALVNSVLEKLSKSEGIVLQYKLNSPLDEKGLEKLENILESKLPKSIRDYYLEMNGCYFTWRLPNTDLMGSLNILPLEECIGGRALLLAKNKHQSAHDGSLYGDKHTASEKKNRKDFKLMERVTLSTLCVAFNYVDKPIKDEIYFIDEDEIYANRLDFELYFNFMVTGLGLFSIRTILLEENKTETLKSNLEIQTLQNKLGFPIMEDLLKCIVKPS